MMARFPGRARDYTSNKNAYVNVIYQVLTRFLIQPIDKQLFQSKFLPIVVEAVFN